MGGDFITNPSRISVRMILSALRSSNFSITTNSDFHTSKRDAIIIIRKLKNNKTGGSDGLVGELLKYGGSGMVDLLQQLFSVIWREEIVPPQWREGLIVNLFKKGDKEDPGNYRGITLLSVVGKVFL